MGWAIPERVQRRLTAAQKEFLNKLLDDGEKSGNKVSAEKAKQKMRKQFDPEDYLPVSTIKSYFSRRASKKKKGEIVDDDASEDEDEVESEAESDKIDVEYLEKQRANLNQKNQSSCQRDRYTKGSVDCNCLSLKLVSSTVQTI